MDGPQSVHSAARVPLSITVSSMVYARLHCALVHLHTPCTLSRAHFHIPCTALMTSRAPQHCKLSSSSEWNFGNPNTKRPLRTLHRPSLSLLSSLDMGPLWQSGPRRPRQWPGCRFDEDKPPSSRACDRMLSARCAQRGCSAELEHSSVPLPHQRSMITERCTATV